MIEGDDQVVQSQSGPSVPVAGRVGVIFYVAVGDVAPVLDITAAGTREIVNGARLPILKVRNTGNAHGRLSGFLSGTDARGQELEFHCLPFRFSRENRASSNFRLRPGAARQPASPIPSWCAATSNGAISVFPSNSALSNEQAPRRDGLPACSRHFSSIAPRARHYPVAPTMLFTKIGCFPPMRYGPIRKPATSRMMNPALCAAPASSWSRLY